MITEAQQKAIIAASIKLTMAEKSARPLTIAQWKELRQSLAQYPQLQAALDGARTGNVYDQATGNTAPQPQARQKSWPTPPPSIADTWMDGIGQEADRQALIAGRFEAWRRRHLSGEDTW